MLWQEWAFENPRAELVQSVPSKEIVPPHFARTSYSEPRHSPVGRERHCGAVAWHAHGTNRCTGRQLPNTKPPVRVSHCQQRAVNSLLDTWEDKLTAAGVDKNEAASKLAAAAKLEPKKGPS